jgi:LuxR family transcriptional regulator, maltose regulon positive regulatory protein
LHRAWLSLVTGELSAAARWAEELPGLRAAREEWPRLIREAEDVLLAGIRLAQGLPAESLTLLSEILQDAEASGRTATVIEVVALQALALDALKNAQQARRLLARSLTLAEPEGYMRMFTEKGEAMARLLAELAADRRGGAVAKYAAALLAATGGETSETPKAQTPALNAGPLVEPLTAREIEILRLLASGASNGDIAAQCVLSVGTVKGHVNHILGKLGVRNRTEAALRARELDLLQT